MNITQGTFPSLPDLTDTEIRAQIDYALEASWAIGIECTKDPHTRNVYCEMWVPTSRASGCSGMRQTAGRSVIRGRATRHANRKSNAKR